MKEVRCRHCNKKLGMVEGAYEIKCPRCGTFNTQIAAMLYKEEFNKHFDKDILIYNKLNTKKESVKNV